MRENCARFVPVLRVYRPHHQIDPVVFRTKRGFYARKHIRGARYRLRVQSGTRIVRRELERPLEPVIGQIWIVKLDLTQIVWITLNCIERRFPPHRSPLLPLIGVE